MTFGGTADWLRPRLWIGIVVGFIPWAVWIASLALGGWYKDSESTLVGSDHLAFYTAAHLIRDGRADQMYDYTELQRTKYEHTLIGWDWRGFEAYRNPPFYALLYWPTAPLSYYTSLFIWTAIGFGLLVSAVWLLTPERPHQALLWSLTFYPVFATFSFGQNTMISLAIFAGVYRLLKNDRFFPAGLVAGLLWYKPQLLLGFFIWWVFAPVKLFRCALGVAIMGGLLAAVCWIVLPDASKAFEKNLTSIVKFKGFGLYNVHTPETFFELLVPESADPLNSTAGSGGGLQFAPEVSVAKFLSWAVSVTSVSLAFLISRRCQTAVGTMFPVAVFLTLWASPHALIYEWALLIAAFTVLWQERAELRDTWLCLMVACWLALSISTPLAACQIRMLGLHNTLQLSIPVLGLVGWVAARQLLRARSNEAQAGATVDHGRS